MSPPDPHPDPEPVAAGSENDTPPNQGGASPRRVRRKSLLVLTFLLFFALVAMTGAQFITLFYSDDIESIIARDGLRPIRPVSNIYSVGDLHTVNFFGEVDNAVCRSDSNQTVEGPGEDMLIGSLTVTEGEAGINAVLDGTSAGQSEVKLEVRLANIKFVSAQSESDLRNVLKNDLISQPECSELIEQKLKAGYCLAQIYSIMIADGTYTMYGSGNASVSAEQSEILKTRIQMELGYDANEFRVGKKLHYGVKMDSLCLTPSDATLVRTVPDNRWWILTPFKNVFHTAWQYFSRQNIHQASNSDDSLNLAIAENM